MYSSICLSCIQIFHCFPCCTDDFSSIYQLNPWKRSSDNGIISKRGADRFSDQKLPSARRRMFGNFNWNHNYCAIINILFT